MAGMRDKLIHDYSGVNLSVVWKAAHDELPKLEPAIRRVVQKLTEENKLSIHIKKRINQFVRFYLFVNPPTLKLHFPPFLLIFNISQFRTANQRSSLCLNL